MFDEPPYGSRLEVRFGVQRSLIPNKRLTGPSVEICRVHDRCVPATLLSDFISIYEYIIPILKSHPHPQLLCLYPSFYSNMILCMTKYIHRGKSEFHCRSIWYFSFIHPTIIVGNTWHNNSILWSILNIY